MHKFIPFLLIVILTILSPACSENNTGVPMQNNFKTDVALLKKLIELPKEPLTVKWQTGDTVTPQSQSLAPGPTDWGLIAIIEFKSNDLAELVSSTAAVTNKKAAILPENLMWDWVKQALGTSSKKADKYYTLDGTPRNVDIFSRSPLLHGYWIQLEDNSILLYLETQ